MGFVTNQWIRDLTRQRERDHTPVEASIDAVEGWDDWAAENGVVLELQATRVNGDYQSIHLTKRDLRSVLRVVVKNGNRATNARLALDLLVSASDAEFVKLISTALQRRLAAQKKHAAGNG